MLRLHSECRSVLILALRRSATLAAGMNLIAVRMKAEFPAVSARRALNYRPSVPRYNSATGRENSRLGRVSMPSGCGRWVDHCFSVRT